MECVELLSRPTGDDLAALMALMRELAPHAEPSAEAICRAVDAPESHVYALREEGMIVGCATLCVFESPTGRKASLEDVVVHSTCRGRGWGRLLVSETLRHAREEFAPIHIQLTSRPQRVAANALYAALGFLRRETNAYALDLFGSR